MATTVSRSFAFAAASIRSFINLGPTCLTRTPALQHQARPIGSAGSARYLSTSVNTPPGPDSTTLHRIQSCKGKVAVVTGAARGIGAQVARGLAEAGAVPAVFDILDEPVAEEWGPILSMCPKAKYYKVNVASSESVGAAFKAVVADLESVDVCVAAAGIIREEAFSDVTAEKLSAQTNVNMFGVFHTFQHAARAMIQQGNGGSLLAIASIASHRPLRAQETSVYSMTKWGVRGLVKTLALELGQYGIRVNSLSPGFVKTPLVEAIITPERLERWNGASPLGRMSEPHELKAPVVFLCSDAASLVTGTDLLADGGVLL